MAKLGLPGFWKVRWLVVSHSLQGLLTLQEGWLPPQSGGGRGPLGLGLEAGLTAGLTEEGSKSWCLELKGPWGWETDKKPSPGLRG